MTEFKIVIGQKDGKSVQKQLSAEESEAFMNKKIGSKINGSLIGFDGYEFEITGGTDSAGFAMRKDVEGTLRKKILAVVGVGLKKKAKGIKQRKRVAGNVIYEETAQINLKILKKGSKPLVEAQATEEPSKEKTAEATPVTETPKVEKTEAVPTKKEAKEEKKEEAPVEEKKENAEKPKPTEE